MPHIILVMVLFGVDLDNTLIYSYRHEIGEKKRCVEKYRGKDASFMTDRTWELLREVSRNALVVPVTTRSVEQYERVELGIGRLSYALTCNGGVLLTEGREETDWYADSLESIRESREELEKAEKIMGSDPNRCFDVRKVRELFLFTKSGDIEASVNRLKESLNGSLLDVIGSGGKVYVMPRELTKGNAVMRLRDRLKAEKAIAAGDSGLDIPMLRHADVAIAPAGLDVGRTQGRLIRIGNDVLFSEEMLGHVLQLLSGGWAQTAQSGCGNPLRV